MVNWIPTALSAVLLLGGGATAYSDLNSDITRVTVVVEGNTVDIKDLDIYDIHLTEKLDTLKGNSIRTETEMSNLQRTTEKLEFTMSELLKEMKRMNDNLIRMGVNDGKSGK